MATFFGDPQREKTFRNQGYVIEPLLDECELNELRRFHEKLNAELPSDFFGTPFSRDVDYRRTIFEVIERVVGKKLEALFPEYQLAMAVFFSKRANGKESKVGLHHDYSLVREDRDVGVNLWIPLVDVDEQNGCLNVVPHSHSVCQHVAAIPSNASPLEPFMPVVERDFIQRVPMSAGAAVVYQGMLLHSSEPNLSDNVRIACGCWMVPSDEAPHMYTQNPGKPGKLDLLRVSKEFLWQLEPEKPILNPYPDGVSFVETVDYSPKILGEEDLEKLRF